MFTTMPILAYNFQPTSCYAPQVSSPLSSSPLQSTPLSPRHGISPQRTRLPMSSPIHDRKRTQNPYSKRVTRSNPLIHNRNDGREARRKLFLKKVKEESADRRWDARGGDDEMMRTIWLAEEKRRAERQAREAMYVPASQEEEEAEETDNSPKKAEQMVDEVAKLEDAEIVSMIERSQKYQPFERYEAPEMPYGSDDDQYDDIFLEVIEEVERRAEDEEYQCLFQETVHDGKNNAFKELSNTSKDYHDMMDTT